MLSQEEIKKIAQEVKDTAEAWKDAEKISQKAEKLDHEDYYQARKEADDAKDYAEGEFIQLREMLIEAVRDDESYPEPGTNSWNDEDENAVITHSSNLSDEIYELYDQNSDDDYYIVSKALEALSRLHEKELPYVSESPASLFIEFCEEIADSVD